MKTATIVFLCASLAVGFVAWRVHAVNHRTINHFALLADPSISYTGGCEAAVGAAETVLHASTVSSRSTLRVLALGDRATAYEPRELAKYEIPSSRKVIENRHAHERRRSAVLHDIWTNCSSVRPTSISPIFLGVKQGLAALRAEGCREGSHCELRVSSDLEENVEPGIKNRLNNVRGRTPLPKLLDNTGTEVIFCGFAATAGQIVDPTGREVRHVALRDPAREDRMQRVWTSVFTNPERVKFEPYCAKPRYPEIYASGGL